MKRHSIEERLDAVQCCKSGMAAKSVAKQFGLDNKQVMEWVLRYDREGKSGLVDRSSRHRVSFSKKLKILQEIEKRALPLHAASAIFHLSQSTLKGWRRIVREGGMAALAKEQLEYYNNDRIKLRLNGMSPVQYRIHTISK